VPESRLTALDGKTLAEVAGDPGEPLAQTGQAPLLAGVVSQRDVNAVSVLSADAFNNQHPSAGAVMTYTATDGDLSGSAAASCQQPANDSWLVGANTSIGRTAVLTLSNASGTPATVNLELFGKDGQIQAPGSRGLLIPPDSARSIVLAGLAPDQDRLAVHVHSVGGPVTALIQQSVLRGLTPGGVDFIAPGTSPSPLQVVSGVDIQDAGQINAMTSKPGFGDAGPSLQLAVPGPVDAVIEVKLFGRDGQKALPSGGVVTAKAGSMTEVPLAGVPAGQYTVSASSDVTFAAAVRVTRGLKTDGASDVAWSPSSARLGSQHVVPVPRSGDRYLVFGAPEGRAKITYTAITEDGKVRQADSADIAGGTTTSIKVPEKVDDAAVLGYIVSASGDPAYGAVQLGQDGRDDISVLAVSPGAEGQEQVPVALGY
jgi:ribosomal protein S18 acetylase RimI-like enzyme